MPKKYVIPKIPCVTCGLKDYWKNGTCKRCMLKAKGERSKIRHQNQPETYGWDKIENTKEAEFRLKEAQFMRGVRYD